MQNTDKQNCMGGQALFARTMLPEEDAAVLRPLPRLSLCVLTEEEENATECALIPVDKMRQDVVCTCQADVLPVSEARKTVDGALPVGAVME